MSEVSVRFGDIWELGRHRLLCGDATQSVMVDELLEGLPDPVLMVTDPPYGVNYSAFDRKKNGRDSRKDKLHDIKIKNDHRASWSNAFMLSKAQIAYVWYPSTVPDVCISALRDGDYQPRQTIIWLKNRFALSRSAYHWKHESCLYAVKNGFNANWQGDRKQSTVWECKSPEENERIHPTQKPIDLYLKPILNHTEHGNIVYDPFSGSGVIFSAAEQTGRLAIGVDLEPLYCERILDRFEKETGIRPIFNRNIFDSIDEMRQVA